MTYKIEYLEDAMDCETCGGNWATGYVITKDGVEVISKRPYAHCYNDITYSSSEALMDILKLEGIEVEECDERY